MVTGKNRVTVHSKLTQVSSTPVGPDKIHPLSALDHSMGLHTLHIIFYYPTDPSGSTNFDRLRVSLSEVLSLYPRLSRREDGKWVVKCNDAGVRILRAKGGTTLDEWLRTVRGSEERALTVWEDMPEDPNILSPFRIQINDFEEGGLAIGLSCTHMHADPTTATLLYKSWTEVHRHEPILHRPLFHPFGLQTRFIPNTHTKSTNYYETKTPNNIKTATATFRFSDSTIKQCLSQINDKCSDVTPFDFLSALFWTHIACLKPPTQDSSYSMSIVIDFRKLIHPPLPYGYFGNAQHFSLLSLDAKEIQGSGSGSLPCIGRESLVCYRLV